MDVVRIRLLENGEPDQPHIRVRFYQDADEWIRLAHGSYADCSHYA